MRSARAGAGAGEERGEVPSGFGLGGGEPGRERQLVDGGAGDQAGEFGEQRGVREDRRGEKAGGGVAVVPEVRGQGVGEPGVDVGLDVPAGSPGQLVTGGFVALAGIGLLQGVELVGAGRDPGGFAQLGLAGGRGFGGELGLDDGVRGVDGARRRGGEQLVQALPLRELRPAADVVGQVLEPGVLPRVEAGVLEGRRHGGVHALGLRDPALGRSRGGLTSKIHMACDGRGRPLAFVVTGGNTKDCTRFTAVIGAIRVPRIGPGRPRTRPDHVLGDKGYSSKAIRAWLRRKGMAHTIPERADQVGNGPGEAAAEAARRPSTARPTSTATS